MRQYEVSSKENNLAGYKLILVVQTCFYLDGLFLFEGIVLPLFVFALSRLRLRHLYFRKPVFTV